MNGLFNMNFMMTFLLGKDLPENRDKILLAMTAAQSPSYLAPIIAAVGPIKTMADQAKENTNLKADLEACRAALADCTKKLTDSGSLADECRELLIALFSPPDARIDQAMAKLQEIKNLSAPATPSAR